MAGPCPPLGRAPELCQLDGQALWLGSVPGPCPPLGRAPLAGPSPPLVLLLAAPLNSQLYGWALCPGLVLPGSVNSVAGLCGWALSSSCSPLTEPLNSVAGLCGWALSSSCPPLGSVNSLGSGLVLLLDRGLCFQPFPRVVLLLAAPLNSVNSAGSVSRPCPPLLLLLAAPLNSVNSVAGLCG